MEGLQIVNNFPYYDIVDPRMQRVFPYPNRGPLIENFRFPNVRADLRIVGNEEGGEEEGVNEQDLVVVDFGDAPLVAPLDNNMGGIEGDDEDIMDEEEEDPEDPNYDGDSEVVDEEDNVVELDSDEDDDDCVVVLEKKMPQKEIERKKRESEEERKKRKHEQGRELEMINKNEMRKLELAQNTAEMEERKAKREMEERERRIRDDESDADEEDRLIRLEEEMIEHKREDLQKLEWELADKKMRNDRKKAEIQSEKMALHSDRLKIAKAREARIRATREIDDHPLNLPLRYSRGCQICTTPNPRRRAVMSSCGHWTCVSCAYHMDKGGQEIDCPFCRGKTKYVVLFEDVETPEVGEETPEGRKRDARSLANVISINNKRAKME